MHDIIVLKIVVRLLLPFILLYALYILTHGELSPGGGFQAGLISATAFIAYSLVTNLTELQKIIPPFVARAIAATGILLYSGVGIVTMLNGGRFLAYYSLGNTVPKGQTLGIMLVEFGISLTVFASTLLIFYSLGGRSNDDIDS